MEHYLARVLDMQPGMSADEWQKAVREEWSMQCWFNSEYPGNLRSACWNTGGISFTATDLSDQQWEYLPGPGRNNWRDETVLVFIALTGAMELEQSDMKTRLTAGSLLVLDPGTPYSQTGERETRGMVLRIPKVALERRGMYFTKQGMVVPDQASADTRMLRSLIASTAAYGERSSPQCAKLVAEHPIDLMQIIAADSLAPRSAGRSAAIFAYAKRFIERNVANEQLDIEAVAKAMGMSTRYITRLFASEGTTIMRYLWHLRLQRAKGMLTDPASPLRINEVAWQCGFTSAAHFSRMFKKHFGVSPKEVRRAGAEGEAAWGMQARPRRDL
jgi:AraC family transcriptional regulator, positive regulator of tynA and feaB